MRIETYIDSFVEYGECEKLGIQIVAHVEDLIDCHPGIWILFEHIHRVVGQLKLKVKVKC